MKGYLLFSGDFYYPEGGWMDFTASFSSLEEAKKVATSLGGGSIVSNIESM